MEYADRQLLRATVSVFDTRGNLYGAGVSLCVGRENLRRRRDTVLINAKETVVSV
jgi:hypothetical protein